MWLLTSLVHGKLFVVVPDVYDIASDVILLLLLLLLLWWCYDSCYNSCIGAINALLVSFVILRAFMKDS